MCIIFRNKSNTSATVFSQTLKGGYIDCTKDTRAVMDATIGPKINEGLKKLFGKFLVIFPVDDTISIQEEAPFSNQIFDENFPYQ
jgi:hypothetical protein